MFAGNQHLVFLQVDTNTTSVVLFEQMLSAVVFSFLNFSKET